MNVTFTVPTTPPGHRPAACWRRTLAGLNPDERGGRAVIGDWLHAGDTVAVPAGTLILSVDKNTTGWDTHYPTGERYPLEDATVAVYLAGADGLKELWRRHFKRAKSAFGAASQKKIARLLEQYPVPDGTVEIVEEARRLNSEPGTCRWCGDHVFAQAGHVTGHGEDAEIEHWKNCPRRRASDGAECALCGVTVKAADAEQVMARVGAGRWETRHRDYLTCTVIPIPSWEEMQRQQQAELEAERKRKERSEKARQRREAKKREKEAAERAAYEAEQERIKGLATVSRTSQELYDKGLGSGRRVRLMEHIDTLEDGTTTKRWTVETYATTTGWTGDDYDVDPGERKEYTRLESARSAYQDYKFDPSPRSERPAGRTCDNCGRPGARHTRYDSSGLPGVVCNSCDRDEDVALSFA